MEYHKIYILKYGSIKYLIILKYDYYIKGNQFEKWWYKKIGNIFIDSNGFIW